MKYYIIIAVFFLCSCTSLKYQHIQIQKKNYTYKLLLPKGSNYDHYCSEEFDLYIYNYADSSSLFLVEGDPNAIIWGINKPQAMTDSLNSIITQENEQSLDIYSIINGNESSLYVNDSLSSKLELKKGCNGVYNGASWKFVTDGHFFVGYFGVKRRKNRYEKTLTKLRKVSNKDENVPYSFYLYDKYENSDFNTNNFQLIDSLDYNENISDILKVFSPVKGNYDVYRFMTHDYGFIDEMSKDSINLLLVTKVDVNGNIIESILYDLRNSPHPFSKYIRHSYKNLKLRNKMFISDFGFTMLDDQMIEKSMIYLKK